MTDTTAPIANAEAAAICIMCAELIAAHAAFDLSGDAQEFRRAMNAASAKRRLAAL